MSGVRANDPIVIHIPHASTRIPARYRRDFLLSGAQLQQELLKMTDRYCNEIFDLPSQKIIFPVSRLVCDVERFRDDGQEEMARIGMGAVYTHGAEGQVMRVPSAAAKEEILTRFYDAHHRALTRAVAQKLAQHGRCLVLDGHSFSACPLPYEPDKSRPDFCIGSDDCHTPRALTDRLVGLLCAAGYTVLVNAPFAGSMVPAAYYRQEPRVMSVMIEINRGLYMDGQGAKTAGYARVLHIVAQLYACCRDFCLSAEP